MHSTDNLKDGYIGSGKRLWHSINYHGKENFKLEILEFLDSRDSLIKREKELVNEDLLNDPMCMNIQLGGGGGCHGEFAAKWSISGIKKRKWLFENDKIWKDNFSKTISKSNKEKPRGFVLSNEGGGKYWIGKSHSDETKQKMSEIKKGSGVASSNSQFGTCWITNGIENKKIKKTEKLPEGWEFGRK